ncbi:MAG: ATP-dependent DNA helicase RecG [candidate division WOR-3 bacterium]|nr:ATP-dependent DNA helicase RecG [candidate division WOR-3 bacterium]
MLRPDTPVQYLKGIGPKRAARLAKLGIETVEDLLFHLPSRYIDRSNPVPIASAQPGQEATFVVKVMGASFRRTRRGPLVQILVADSSAQLYVIWFNRPDLRGKFNPGEKLLVSGQITFYERMQMVNPFFERLDANPDFFERPIFPVYPLTEGLAAWGLRRAANRALDELDDLPETIPPELMQRHELPGIMQALQYVHRPKEMAEIEKGVRRLRYEELFYFETLIAMRRRSLEQGVEAEPLAPEGKLTKSLLEALPFELTGDQIKVIAEIGADISRKNSMHRLLQGDVGSGKTVVALYAMLAAVDAGRQAAMMAPTEILAEQHYEGWKETLEKIGAKPLLLTGSLKNKDKEERREMIARGEANMVFGTHALIEENVEFCDLGLVVVDEQHRFGVMQRAALASKNEARPHVLVMSATPIPRTLTLSYYGDLDVSVIKEKPKGRAERTTELAFESRKEGVYRWLQERLTQGDRAYVVCPLIEESEKLELSSAKQTYDELAVRLGDEHTALMHGRMKTEERRRAMEGFRKGEVKVLVSTTVIEVGVDVAEASIMIIMHPERFGLAQLHQLRGRIGRGKRPSRCVLLMPSGLSPEASERLNFFANTEDGFLLAEEDLRIRGPGQIMGRRQHGLPDLRIADLLRDRDLLLTAREDAFKMLKEDPELKKHPRVAATIRRRHAKSLELLGVA